MGRMQFEDSVPLDAFSSEVEPASGVKTKTGRESRSSDKNDEDLPPPRIKVENVKLIITIFVIFLIVVSDVFTNNVISGFGEKAVRCRVPTAWGVVLQGIFLVFFYIIAVYLTEHHIL